MSEGHVFRHDQPWLDLPEGLLVISCSARMLVESAKKAHINTFAIDHYADSDTRLAALKAVALVSALGTFDDDLLLDAADQITPGPKIPMIYGSGFDSQPDLLERLSKGREIIGNPPPLQRLFKEPRRFFDLLRQLDIPFPETHLDLAEGGDDWLVKSGCSEGGKGVRFCAHKPLGPLEYLQRRLSGPAYSALFLADGRKGRIIGFNTLWNQGSLERPFLFVGAIHATGLSGRQRQTMRGIIQRLVQATGLVGLNSLDFMLSPENQVLVIEVNPRPSASMALYDDDFPEGLVAAHIRACRGHLSPVGSPSKMRAFKVMMASRKMVAKVGHHWPSWCQDRPVDDTVIHPNQPLCTIRAEGTSEAEVLALLDERRALLEQTMALASA
ncbi:MAG: ATP-grasp domain-containing protein [Gammaproteobacteria bacterium]|nr:ATP-grasp domain-containing protein [Gammaproteobacteria bacterium]NBT44906.1 ATP-grasp domain-containing protein [Gammaproteobacteria bacterium]NBY22667.1 ATP-grasp domain-containing protein [Gammaproteobacteria bacterium]NDE33415.1 ATP-grasp domain-containing protein [Gammaproteobacteria bacterium]NDE55498.1 ATP-grasp domain-containing protein [Gammaproteobacteria bacterium]